MKHDDAIFSREETSPDGSLHICYNHQEGEKSPTVVEPCVSVAATREVLFDFWRTRLNGHLDEFTPIGFRLTVSDNFGLTKILVQVDSLFKVFTLVGEPGEPKPLALLMETLDARMDAARREREALSAPPPVPRSSLGSRIARWLTR